MATWKKIGSLFGTNSTSNTVSEITVDGKKLTGCDLANAFNEYLVTTLSSPVLLNNTLKMVNSCSDSVFLAPVTEAEVFSTIIQLRNSNSSDPFDFKLLPIKLIADIISRPLTSIFNLCFSTGTFPVNLQTAKVILLYKKGDKNSFGHYRPISILPIISKVFEKVLYSRLASFTDKQKILSDAQFGFRKHRSTELALLAQKEFILHQIEDRKFVLGIFIDFSKAFDSLDRKLLLKKLELYGIRGRALEVIESYLGNRQQYVNVNNSTSLTKRTYLGVPQGSILGPYLFNIFINDIVLISSSVKFIIYVDDTSLFLANESCTDLISRGNEILGKLCEWAITVGNIKYIVDNQFTFLFSLGISVSLALVQ